MDTTDKFEELVHLYMNGTFTADEQEQLFIMLREPHLLQKFNELSDIWLSSAVLQNVHTFDSEQAFERLKARIDVVNESNQSNKAKFLISWHWAAAILLLAIISSVFVSKYLFEEKKPVNGSAIVFEVPYGSKSNITLGDGSLVTLNAGSKLQVTDGFGTTHRTLELTGEGYFKVAKNAQIPFVVQAGNIGVKAIGTEFNIKAYPEENTIETILVEGIISVSEKDKSDAQALILKPKQTFVYNKGSGNVQIKTGGIKEIPADDKKMQADSGQSGIEYSNTPVDPVIYTTWKEICWNVYQKRLEDLAIELERKYNVVIYFESEALKAIKFSGRLKDESLEQVLAAISLASPIEYRIKGNKVELKENKILMRHYRQYFSKPE